MNKITVTPQVSSRVRTTAFVVAVAGLGLTLLVIAISFMFRTQVGQQMNDSIRQEVSELQRFATVGTDPETDGPFTDAERFVTVYLDRQTADPHEMLVGGAQGADPARVIRGKDAPTPREMSVETRQQLLTVGSADTIQDPAIGKITYQNVELNVADTSPGYVLVASFHKPALEAMNRQLVLIALLAVVSLVLTGTGAWWVAGRITGSVDEFEQAVEHATTQPGVPSIPESGSPDMIRLAQSANRLTDVAERAVEQERQFTQDVTHELRTPIAVIDAELSRPPLDDADRARSLEKISDQVSNLQILLGHLAVVNRVDRPDYVQPDDAMSVRHLIEGFTASWEPSTKALADKNVTLVADVSGVGLQVQVDRIRMNEALQHLTDNAIDASEFGSSVVIDAMRHNDGDDQWVWIEVRDRGRGIPEGQHDKVIQRFAHASNDESPGVGLGLAIIDSIVRAHHGRLELLDGTNGGTTARIWLPRNLVSA